LSQYRSRLQIIADILTVVRNGGARKTRIMYQANLSYKLLNQYLGYAMEIDLVSISSDDKGHYVITPKGFEFLDKYKKYSQRKGELEEQLKDVANEKAILEKIYVAKWANSESRNSFAKKNKAVESSA